MWRLTKLSHLHIRDCPREVFNNKVMEVVLSGSRFLIFHASLLIGETWESDDDDDERRYFWVVANFSKSNFASKIEQVEFHGDCFQVLNFLIHEAQIVVLHDCYLTVVVGMEQPAWLS